jgi:hypothetical protein
MEDGVVAENQNPNEMVLDQNRDPNEEEDLKDNLRNGAHLII